MGRRKSRFAAARPPPAREQSQSFPQSSLTGQAQADELSRADEASTLQAGEARRTAERVSSSKTVPVPSARIAQEPGNVSTSRNAGNGAPVVETKPASFSFVPARRGRGVAKRRRTGTALKSTSVGVHGLSSDKAEKSSSIGEESDGSGETGRFEPRLPAGKRRRFLPGSAEPIESHSSDPVSHKNTASSNGTREVDPLDAYMQDIEARASSALQTTNTVGPAGDVLALEDGVGNEDGEDPSTLNIGEAGGYLDRNARKRPVYQQVDHSKIDYQPFEKKLYREVPELARMSPDEVRKARRALGSVRIRGKGCPKPVLSFGQCGLSSAVLDVIRRAQYEAPTPIQAQAIPCIMDGRDVIGVAKTGSGKTLAFVLPVIRHVSFQERPAAGEGPIAMLIAPTRELAIQIYYEAKRFAKATDLRCVCAYGGTGLKDQISDLKRGADIVVCTPGRMIDMLAMNSGRVTNLRRVSIVVLDEADRMFDMGFEPQLTRLVENVRPDRQTVMFSATFPPQVERLARRILKQPVEIVIGGNSVAATSIRQHVEVRSEDSKFFRLLQLLGVWYEKGSTLVFVDRQDNADKIFRELSQAGYLCWSLHGGMDQADRDSALADFKNGDVKVLVATSVAARGLDVKQLTLVVNFDVPNHYEDYVHRVGRTGRAGRTGTAYTFITPDQDMFAADMVKALELSARSAVDRDGLTKEEIQKAGDDAAEDAVSEELRELAKAFKVKQEEKRKAGIVVHGSNSGYGGRGFTFDENEDAAKDALRKSQAKRFKSETDGADVGDGSSDSEDDGEKDGEDDVEIKVVQRSKSAIATVAGASAAAVASAGGNAPPNGTTQSGTRSQRSTPDVPVDTATLFSEAEAKAREEAAAENLDEAATAARLVLAKVAVRAKIARQQQMSQMAQEAPESVMAGRDGVALSAAAAAAAALSQKLSAGKGDSASGATAGGPAGVSASGVAADDDETCFEAELEINDYPQHARWRVTHANALEDVTENTGCVATTRGNYYPAGRNPPVGERKLHLLIEGPDERSVKSAWKEIKRKLEEAAAARPDDRGGAYSKYSVL